MPDWQNTLTLEKFRSALEGSVPPYGAAREIAELLPNMKRGLTPSLVDERDEIADAFKSFADDASGDHEDFNTIMERLYKWADTRLDDEWNGKKVCWIQIC